MGNKKGQAAFEYLMITIIALSIVSPLLLFVNQRAQMSRRRLESQALEDSLDSLVETADLVYSQGYPAKSTVEFYAPDAVVDSQITDGRVVVEVMYEGTVSDYHASSIATLEGSLPEEPGNHELVVKALKNDHVRIE